MPQHKRIKTLFELSEDILVKHFVTQWEVITVTDVTQEMDEIKTGFRAILQQLPCTLLNDIVAQLLKEKCLKNRKRDKTCELLSVTLNSKLTTVDLGDLVKLGEHSDGELEDFEDTLLSLLPRLTKVTTLSLTTHSLKTTLPICTDRMLEEISFYIRSLRVLDISNNNLVTDSGLECLISDNGSGCPLLEELFIYECSVTVDGVALVIDNLSRLRILGYKDTGNALRSAFRKFRKCNDDRLTTGLNLTHINQTVQHCSYFDESLVEITKLLCPFAFNLKVVVKDHHVPRLKRLTSVKSLDLTYRLSTLGRGTFDYFKASGHQLYSLTLTCGTFSSKHFIVIGKCCPNLQHLWFTCYNMSWDLMIEKIERRSVFSELETLYFRVGFSENDKCLLPVNVFKYILHNTSKLKDLRIICRSETLTDIWLKDLWQSFRTDMLLKVLIALPYLNYEKKVLALTMSSVNVILECSPNLKYLGNLRIWNVSSDEVAHLRDYLSQCNFDINISNHTMKIK